MMMAMIDDDDDVHSTFTCICTGSLPQSMNPQTPLTILLHHGVILFHFLLALPGVGEERDGSETKVRH